MQYITSIENILLSYRNIKKNRGSKIKGVNQSTILSVAEKNPEALISYVRNRLDWFTPHLYTGGMSSAKISSYCPTKRRTFINLLDCSPKQLNMPV